MCEGSMYSYISHTYQQELKERSPEVKRRMIAWRRGPRVVRIARPTRLEGQGSRLQGQAGNCCAEGKGCERRHENEKACIRKKTKTPGYCEDKGYLSEKKVAVQRAYARYPNLWALGSYFLARDGRFSWYEVVMVDPHHPSIKADSEFRRRLQAKL